MKFYDYILLANFIKQLQFKIRWNNTMCENLDVRERRRLISTTTTATTTMMNTINDKDNVTTASPAAKPTVEVLSKTRWPLFTKWMTIAYIRVIHASAFASLDKQEAVSNSIAWANSMYRLTHCLAGIKARYSPGVTDLATDRRSYEYTVQSPRTPT